MGNLRMPKTADVVAARVRSSILAQQLAPGTPLPSEHELIKHFGVSRASVREALRLLEAEGLVEVRRGVRGGVFTAEISTERFTRVMATLLARREIPVADLLDLRLVLEPEAAAMAASRAPAPARERLLALAEEPGHDHPVDHAEFHDRLADLSGNGLMALFLGSLRDIVAETAIPVDLPESMLDLTTRAHIQIAKAIALGNEAAARRATVRHLRDYLEHVRASQDPGAPIVSFTHLSQESIAAG